MTRALEKIADRTPDPRDATAREVVCHRCGTQCLLPAGARLAETLCVGCVQRLQSTACGDRRPAPATRALADWADKAAAPGPGYGLVTCPHCDADCVVEVGETARTGCGVCLRPLGTVPLLRTDLTVRNAAAAFSGADAMPGRYAVRWPTVTAAAPDLALASDRS